MRVSECALPLQAWFLWSGTWFGRSCLLLIRIRISSITFGPFVVVVFHLASFRSRISFLHWHFLCFLFLACSHTRGFPAANNSAHDLGLGTTKKMFVQSCMHPSILFDDGWQQQQSGPEWMRPLCVLTQPDQSGPLLYNRLIS